MEHHTETSGHFSLREKQRDRDRSRETPRKTRKRDRKRWGKGSRLYKRGSPNSQMKANSCVQLSEAAHLKEGLF